ncbi:MAG: FG-GAP repeat domain-containing protein, partial [Limisphaerales bacterium]
EITFHSQGEQIGSGSLPFTVAENPTATSRVFNVTVAGIPVRIIQAGRLAHPPLHLSGEGYPDLVWQNKSGTTISWTTPVLNVAPRPGFFITPPQNWRIVANNDFDSDGKTDFFVRHLDGRYGFWEMTSAPFFKLTVLNRALSQDWRVVGIDNFDQTGGNDIVWQHTHGRVAVWLMHGTNFLSAVTLNNGKASSRWKAVAVGDFNDDQHPDVLFQSTDGYLAVWLMQGLSRTSTVVLNSDKPTPPYWKIVGAGDFNRDEYLDIVWQHQDGRVAVWLMEGLVRKSSYMLWDRSTEWKVVGPK